MNSDTTYTISTISSDATIEFGQKIGKCLMGGDVVELKGDIGSGKTTLTKGILAGKGYKGDVVSPTYTLSRTYSLPGGEVVCHFDFYRLHGHDAATKELHEALLDPRAISIIEWPGQGDAELPVSRIRITLEQTENTNHRTILLEGIGDKAQSLVTQVHRDYRH